MLRPIPTVWFELLVLRHDLPRAMDCAARTRVVQLEARAPTDGALRTVRGALSQDEARFEAIAERLGGYFTPPVHAPVTDAADIAARFRTAVNTIEAWAADAEDTVATLEAVRAEMARLSLIEALLSNADHALPDLGLLSRVGPRMASLVAYAPIGTEAPDIPDTLPVDRVASDDTTFLLALGPVQSIRDLATGAKANGWQALDLPDWLPAEPDAALETVRHRLDAERTRCRNAERDLTALSDRHALAEALGIVERLRWLLGCAREVDESDRLARITGWALLPEIETLGQALAACDLHHVLVFPEPPDGLDPPVVLFNPVWARRFEALTQMIGMPGSGEADPTVVVALIAPLLFGFMFGDVGQGFVLLLAGLALRRRYPALSILIPGGAMSMVFGFMFGSVFGREDVIPALWLHPLNEPITLLGVSVAAGAVILLMGLTLRALQMRWQGQWQDWLAADAGLVLCYLGLLAAFVLGTPGLIAALAGAIWFVAGKAWSSGLGAAPKALGGLVETILQLLVNTVSFARAGAFALAHAGLSVAIVGLADASGAVFYWPVLVLGNVFVMVLEGLVVSIQTTRLLLFEFFIRFLTGGGRVFRPLIPPGHPQRHLKEAY